MESLFEQNASLLQELLKNDEYRKELALLEKECSSDSSKFYENSKKLTEKYMPELQEIDEKISSFVTYKDVSEQEQSDIRKAFSSYFKDLFSKNQNIVIELNKAMSSPEYQHRAQLLAEKFADNKNSEEYINAQNELIYEFYPKIKELHRELAAISKGKK
ncbi:MAG: hypothetical protein CL947_01915 [Epsilonproteobacteria bacterium]|nr:hypothetical protein [Campylobacterota bacterium]